MRDGSVQRPFLPLIVAAMLVLLSSGCSGGASDTASPSSPTSPSTTTPTATSSAAGPLTAQERAWLAAIARLHQRMDKEFLSEGSVTLTPAKLRSWETLMRNCSKELDRLGDPGTRLQPVAALVEQACRQYDKGAACYAAARRILNDYTATKKVDQNLTCAGNAAGDGSNQLADAEAKGREIDLAAG
jgi:hypothetical protein